MFCGSRPGASPAFAQAARELGRGLALRGATLVYGGGDVGLMGIAANAATDDGGRVIGIIPSRLMAREAGKHDIAELIVTETMAERKTLMIERSDAFAVLPGGLGTLDEVLEVITLKQLGYHDKPILLIDVEGYWRPFLAMYRDVIAHGFAAPSVAGLIETAPDVATVLGRVGNA